MKNFIGTLLIYLRKSWILIFTRNPYKIVSFHKLNKELVGVPVERAESLTTILQQDSGSVFFYQGIANSFEQQVNRKNIGRRERFQYKGVFVEPQRTLYSLDNGRIFSNLGIIYEQRSRSFIDQSTKEWTTKLKYSKIANVINFPEITYYKGIALSCVTNGADGGFYHFFFESLTRLAYCSNLITHLDYIVFNGPISQWKLKWIKRTGIDLQKILWMENNGHFQFDQLLFTNKLVDDQQITPWAVESLKRLLNVTTQAKSTTHSILWITRSSAISRMIQWEDRVLSLFPSIEKVDLALLDDQVTMEKLSSATHIVGPHGAGFSNLIFCEEQTVVLELFPKGSNYIPCYTRLSDVCKLEHSIAYVNFDDPDDESYGIQHLQKILRSILC